MPHIVPIKNTLHIEMTNPGIPPPIKPITKTTSSISIGKVNLTDRRHKRPSNKIAFTFPANAISARNVSTPITNATRTALTCRCRSSHCVAECNNGPTADVIRVHCRVFSWFDIARHVSQIARSEVRHLSCSVIDVQSSAEKSVQLDKIGFIVIRDSGTDFFSTDLRSSLRCKNFSKKFLTTLLKWVNRGLGSV